jgi:hypothetical protein
VKNHLRIAVPQSSGEEQIALAGFNSAVRLGLWVYGLGNKQISPQQRRMTLCGE